MAWRRLVVLCALAVLVACGRPAATPTATPVFLQYRSAAGVLADWRRAGVPLGETTPLAATDGRAGAIEAVEFAVPAAPGAADAAPSAQPARGRILVFTTPEALSDAEWFYRNLSTVFPYLFRRHNVLVVLDGYVTAEQAGQYQRAVESLR